MRDAYRYDTESLPGLDKRQRRRIARRDRRRYVASRPIEFYCLEHGVLWRGFEAESRTGPLSLLTATSGHHFGARYAS